MLSYLGKCAPALLVVVAVVSTIPAASAAAVGFSQINLTSDVPGMAPNTDPNLKNPWGMSFSPTSPFWLSDQAAGVATLYNGAGVPNALVVSTPPLSPPPAGPTGQVFVGGLGFSMGGGVNANFIFSTLSGTVDAWNAGTSAVTEFTAQDGAIYTGLAQLGNLLYVADTKNGKIDVLNNTFQKTTVSGSFSDPNVPAGLTPYNIQTITGKLYVEYAQRNAPGGFIAVYDANGNLLQEISDSHLTGPWGITLAPSTFGDFGGDLLVGNFGNGMINAFNPVTGAFIGTLSDAGGHPIVNSGLWALNFRGAGSGFNPNALFFSAGINNEADGLFGEILANPEPATLGTMLMALAAGGYVLARRRSA
jgi:uncharacterized protein (TIGR03118 family)